MSFLIGYLRQIAVTGLTGRSKSLIFSRYNIDGAVIL